MLTTLVFPLGLKAELTDLSANETEPIDLSSEIEAPLKMSQEEVDLLLGPDPYLGPTSWIESKRDHE